MWRYLALAVALCVGQPGSAVTHSLRNFFTGVGGVRGFPEFTAVGLVDRQEFIRYDSDSQKAVPKTEWIEKKVDKDYWDRETQIAVGTQPVFKVAVVDLPQRFNQSAGVHTWQNMYGCELDDDGTTRGFWQYGYDGADYISLDMSTLTWTAANQRGMTTKLKWDPLTAENQRLKAYLENTCIEWLRKYVDYGRETLLRTERPQVSVSHKDSRLGGTELTCLATGFFPKDVTVSWRRDGQDLQEDVDSGEVVPNGDGSFQVRKSLRVRAGEEEKYSCHVDHKSLEKTIVQHWEPPSSSLVPIIAAVCAVVALAVIAAVAVVLVRRRKSSGGQKPIYRQAAGKEPGDSASNSSA